MIKQLIGLIQVAMIGQCTEGDDLGGGMRIQKGARNCEMGLNLPYMCHG